MPGSDLLERKMIGGVSGSDWVKKRLACRGFRRGIAPMVAAGMVRCTRKVSRRW